MFKNEIDCLIGSIEANDAGNPFENADELIRRLQRSAIAARLPVGPLHVFTSNNGDEGPRRRIANGFKAYRPGQAPRSGIPPALSWIYSGLRGSKPWERTAREWNPIRKKLIAILRQWANFGAAPSDTDLLWANARWIRENCQVTSDDIRTRRNRVGDINARTPTRGAQPEYYLPDIEKAFPKKAPALVKKFRSQFLGG